MKSKYILMVVAGIILSSCSEKKFDEIDTDPKNPVNVPVKSLIPSVTAGVPYYVNGTELAFYCSVFSEQTAGTYLDMRSADRRQNINSQLSENAWQSLYTTVMMDLNTIILKGSTGGDEEGNWKYVGIAQVLMAYTMGTTTDIWGRVPFSEAFQGEKNRKPKYDNQKDIYEKLQSMLDEAIVNLDKDSRQTPGTEDMIYSGDTEKWKKAAYAVKARLYNHLSKIDPAGSAQNALNCIAKSFSSSDDDLIFKKWSGSLDATHQNTWYRESAERSQMSLSLTMDSLMLKNNDPRLYSFFTGTNAALNGQSTEDPSDRLYSVISSNVLYPDASLPMITYEEIKFIEAECNLRIGQSNAANMKYQHAVYSALKRYGIDSTEVSPIANLTFYNNVLKKEPEDITVELIVKQKYIALFPFQSVEAYTDWRRTGFPKLKNPLGNPPRRFPYPQNEISSNGANVPAVVTTSGVWWDDGSED